MFRTDARLFALSFVSVLMSSATFAQSWQIPVHTIGASGSSSGGSFELHATIGQSDAAAQPMSGGAFALTGGFWPPAQPATSHHGDLNCDGLVNNFDIQPFVLALTNPAAYAAAFPNCNINNADINGDGAVNNFDITPFVVCLTSGCP